MLAADALSVKNLSNSGKKRRKYIIKQNIDGKHNKQEVQKKAMPHEGAL